MEPLLSVFKALADSTRLRLFRILARHELTVTELTYILNQSQPRISRHLKLLCTACLVYRFQEGSWVFYRLSSNSVAQKIAELVLNNQNLITNEMIEDDDRLKIIQTQRTEKAQTYFQDHAVEWETFRQKSINQDAIDAEVLLTLEHYSACFSQNKGTLVDLGTGTGYVIRRFSAYFLECIGVDNSAGMLKIARNFFDKMGLSHAQARQGELTEVLLPDEVADVVTLQLVLHYTSDPVAVLKEASRILKTDGLLIICDYEQHHFDHLRDVYMHRRLGFDEDSLSQMGRDAKLTRIKSVSIPPLSSPDNKKLWPDVRLWAFKKMV